MLSEGKDRLPYTENKLKDEWDGWSRICFLFFLCFLSEKFSLPSHGLILLFFLVSATKQQQVWYCRLVSLVNSVYFFVLIDLDRSLLTSKCTMYCTFVTVWSWYLMQFFFRAYFSHYFYLAYLAVTHIQYIHSACLEFI